MKSQFGMTFLESNIHSNTSIYVEELKVSQFLMELCRIVSRMWRNCRREEARERWGIEMTSAAANTDAFSAAASNFLQNLPQHFVFISLLFITSQPDWRHQLGQYWESESDDKLMLLFPSPPPSWEFALQTKNSQLSPSRLVLWSDEQSWKKFDLC